MGCMKANEGKTVHLRPLGGARVLGAWHKYSYIYIHTDGMPSKLCINCKSALSLSLDSNSGEIYN